MILDQQEAGRQFRENVVAEASYAMYNSGRKSMLEAPIQAESHLFQTLQCADWLCGLIGRVACFKVLPEEYADLAWTQKYFSARLKSVAPKAGIRHKSTAIKKTNSITNTVLIESLDDTD